jgi:hypothetical protein
MVDGLAGVGQQAEVGVKPAGGAVITWMCDQVTAADIFEGNSGDIHGCPATGHGCVFFLLVGLQAAHSSSQPLGKDFHLISHAQYAVA